MVSGMPVELEMTMPRAAVDPVELLPVFWAVESRLLARALEVLEAGGGRVSCRAGCGACCRQFVPVSRTEARALAALVAAMPVERRERVRARFEAGMGRLADAGLLASIDALGRIGSRGRQDLGLAWFALGIACPFLEDESCSIHPQRPLACREYLVSSPPAACADPRPETVRVVPLAGSLSRAAARLDDPEGPGGMLPLLFALDAARVGSGPDAPLPAPVLVRRTIERLASASGDRAAAVNGDHAV